LVADLSHCGCQQQPVSVGRISPVLFEAVAQDRIEISTGTGRQTEGHLAFGRPIHELIQSGAKLRPKPPHVLGTCNQLKAACFDVGDTLVCSGFYLVFIQFQRFGVTLNSGSQKFCFAGGVALCHLPVDHAS